MKKHIWIAGIKINQLVENSNHAYLNNLKWVGEIPSSYSIHIFENENNTAGVIACSDAFGGRVAWARYTGENTVKGAEFEQFDSQERDFLNRKYPEFLKAIDEL